MLSVVKGFIQDRNLIGSDEKVLITVSGGRDSVVLLMVMKQLGYDISVAHVNFGLRGEESDKDEVFVRELCESIEVPFYSNRMNATAKALEKGASIQMVARDMRYEWFEELTQTHNIDKIATAHHLDDQLETILINLTRGTGIKGLRGMKEKRGKIIRPLLCVSREEINQYIFINQIGFREDSSNASGKYYRNKIRNEIIPILKEINPSICKAINNTTSRLRSVEEEWESHYKDWQTKIETKGNKQVISFDLLKKENPSFIKQFLRAKGFSYPDIDNVLAAVKGEKGKFFNGKDRWRLDVADGAFELYQIEPKDQGIYFLDGELPLSLDVQLIPTPHRIEPSITTAYINADKVQGRLYLRKWKDGDWFIPFGMYGKQKISDYFINNKFSIEEKEATWLLCDEEKVVWIVGYRTDNRYRVGPGTRNCYVLQLN